MKKRLNNVKGNLLALVIAIAMVFSLLPAVAVDAATFPGPNGMSISVERGITTLKLSNGSTVQLTEMLIAKDGGACIDANGTAYVIYRSGYIYLNNYQLQGNNVLYSLGYKVLSFQTDSNGYATGFVLADGTVKAVPTLEEVKKMIGITTSDNTNTSDSTSNNSNTNTNTNQNTSTSETKTTVTSGVKLSNGVVTYTASDGKKYKIMSNSLIDKVGIDKNNTIWIHLADGRLYVWNYGLQKNETTPKPHKVTDKATSIVIKGGKVVGYYVSGTSSIKRILTVTEVKKLITPAKKTTSKTVYAYTVNTHHNVINTHKRLMNSKGKQVDTFVLTQTAKNTYVLKYKGKTYKNVYRAEFNKQGNVVYIDKNGVLYVINHSTNKRTKKATGIKKFLFSKSFAVKALRKNGKKFSINNY